jgi:hypothetical protein
MIDEGREWTVADVVAVIVNPIYTGIPPFPRIVHDGKWIGGMKRRMAEVGPDLALSEMLEALRQTYAQVVAHADDEDLETDE